MKHASFKVIVAARMLTDLDIMNDCRELSEAGVWMDSAKLRDVTSLYQDISKFSQGSLSLHLSAPMTIAAIGELSVDDNDKLV